jgi:di/tricarboxylate transporter
MARSPIFLFMIILVVAVAFVMAVAIMQANTPTDGAYNQSNSTINQSQQFLSGTAQQAPNWVIPAILISVILFIIGVVLLLGKKR